MPSETQPTMNPMVLLVIGLIAFKMGLFPGISPAPAPGPGPDPSTPVVDDQPTEANYWESLATCVEKQSIGGELQQHTDHILKVVDVLKDSGKLTDVSRCDRWLTGRIDITDRNRQEIADTLRGK